MAVAVDSAWLLADEICRTLNVYGDLITLVGILYTGKTVLSAVCSVTKGITTFILPMIWTNKETLCSRYGKWAVVTGVNDALAKAYALELAEQGLNIMIIDIRKHDLADVATEIGITYGVETRALTVNFCEGSHVFDRISAELEKIEIGILVNTIAVFQYGPMFMCQMTRACALDLITVNIAASTVLSQTVLPSMLKRNKGAIVFLCSSVGVGPISLLAATKPYVLRICHSLEEEVRDKGIVAQILTPCQITSSEGGGGLFTPSAAVYAKSAVTTLGFSSHTTGYWAHELQSWAISLIPPLARRTVSSLINKYYRKKRHVP